jgi:hypothetical protein
MKTFLVTLTTCAALMSTVAVADGPTAISTAATHAGMAAAGTDVAGVRRHLHHVLNCLVGADGQGFNATPGNPCAQAGGAIPQTTDAAVKAKLQKAAETLRAAVTNDNLDAAKKAATEVQALLK